MKTAVAVHHEEFVVSAQLIERLFVLTDVSWFMKKICFLAALMLSGIFCCRASDWELMKFDNNYAEINSSAGLVLSISKVEYRDVTSEVAHMSELMGCDRPVFEKDNKNFTVKNCKIGSARQNIYARQLEQDEGKKTPATYLQVYLIGDSLPADAEFEKEALAFLEKNYIDNPYEGWIENRLSGEKSSFLVENLSLRTSITVNMAEYPEEKEQKRDDYRAGLAKTLLCKDSKQNGEVFVMSDCSTFKVYEIRELADRLYVLFSINFDSYDKPEVKAKLDELYEQLKKDNQ